MKIAVYVELIPGDYTILRSPFVVSNNADYFVFTDRPLKVPPFRDVVVPKDLRYPYSTRRECGWYKAMAHEILPGYDYTICHDGNVRMKILPEEVVALLGELPMILPPHPLRDCAYQEARACRGFPSNSAQLIDVQVARMKTDRFPEHVGLPSTNFVVRKSTDEIRQFNERWQDEIHRGSQRTQVSFSYAAWKTGVKWGFLPGAVPWQDNEIYWMGR